MTTILCRSDVAIATLLACNVGLPASRTYVREGHCDTKGGDRECVEADDFLTSMILRILPLGTTAISEFYYLQDATWEVNYAPETKDSTVQQYAESGLSNKNFVVVGQLVNKPSSGLLYYESDLDLAKEILREKFVIGLMNEMDESVRRFDLYFDFHKNDETNRCVDDDEILHPDNREAAGLAAEPIVTPTQKYSRAHQNGRPLLEITTLTCNSTSSLLGYLKSRQFHFKINVGGGR